MLSNKNWENTRFTGWSLLIIALCMWVVNLGFRYWAQDVLDHGISSSARVEEIVNAGTFKVPSPAPVVIYDAVTRPVLIRHITYLPNTNDTIQIVYHRDHPRRAVMAGVNPWDFNFSRITLLLFGVPIVGLVILIYSFSQQQSQSYIDRISDEN